MNKKEFLAALGQAIPHRGKSRSSILNFYGEMIDDLVEEGLTEEEATQRIGRVEELAEQIREDGELSSGKKDRRGVGEIILLILGAPLWIALLLAGFSVLIAIYAVLWSLILALWAIELPFLLFSIVSKYLLPGCTVTTLGALALTKKSAACVLRLFKREPVL